MGKSSSIFFYFLFFFVFLYIYVWECDENVYTYAMTTYVWFGFWLLYAQQQEN